MEINLRYVESIPVTESLVICRAVATLFSKIGTLRGDAGGWEDRLADAINWYKNWTEGNTTSQPHAVSQVSWASADQNFLTKLLL